MSRIIDGIEYFAKSEVDEMHEKHIKVLDDQIRELRAKEVRLEELESRVSTQTVEDAWGTYFDRANPAYNLTRQAELMRTDVELYKRLVEKYKYSRKR